MTLTKETHPRLVTPSSAFRN